MKGTGALNTSDVQQSAGFLVLTKNITIKSVLLLASIVFSNSYIEFEHMWTLSDRHYY